MFMSLSLKMICRIIDIFGAFGYPYPIYPAPKVTTDDVYHSKECLSAVVACLNL